MLQPGVLTQDLKLSVEVGPGAWSQLVVGPSVCGLGLDSRSWLSFLLHAVTTLGE